MNIISKLFSRSEARPKIIKTSATNPYRIANPVAGFICLAPALRSQMDADVAALGSLFSETRTTTEGPVPCHVLFLYCKLERDGAIQGFKARIRDIVKASGAYVAIVASENTGEQYRRALHPENDWPANIVLVIDRRGPVLARFLGELFGAMKTGTSMLIAWVKLAPQTPKDGHPNCPITLLIAEAGHISLDGRA